MKRILTIVFALSLVATSAFAQGEDYGWSISGSNTDPNQSTGAPVGGAPFSLYLWLTCTTDAGGTGGWASMECDVQLAGPGGPLLLGFTPLNGVLNGGAGTLLQLAVGGCPTEGFLAGSFSLFDAAGLGLDVCLVDSSGPDNWNVTVDCDPLNATTHQNAVTGYSSTGTAPCVLGECGVVSVEDASWGSIKGLYR